MTIPKIVSPSDEDNTLCIECGMKKEECKCKKVKKDFIEMDVADLFDSMFEQIEEEVAYEKKSGKTLKETVTDPRMAKVHSQKAKSLLKYIQTYKAGQAVWIAPATEVILLDDEWEIVLAAYHRVMKGEEGNKAFVRACPEVARHGVLESVMVTEATLMKEWQSLIEMMKVEDPNGCLMIQPFIPATSSSVLAPQMHATIATGHDGVTAGHGRMLYLLFNPDDNTMSAHMDSLGHERGTYEIEMVYQKTPEYKTEKSSGPHAYLTQIRNSAPHKIRAPPFTYYIDKKTGIPVTTKYIDPKAKPKVVDKEYHKSKGHEKKTATVDVAIPGGQIEVKKVWEASGLEEVAWLEANITKDKVPEGFVISHPIGGSLMSHICAHGRQHGIPYIVSEVKEGDRWTEGSETWGALDPEWKITPGPYDPCTPDLLKAFKRGLYRSQTHWQRQQGWFGHFFHQWVGTGTNGKESAYLAGGFCGWMSKAILALCLGEIRHAKKLKKDACVDLWPVLTAMMGSDKWNAVASTKIAGSTRLHYYSVCEHIIVDYREMKLALEWCVKQFDTGWSGGYGGKAWSECARLGVEVCDAIIKFTNTPDVNTLKQLIGAVNAAKNAVHNNGFLYGKFLSIKAFEYSSAHSVKGQKHQIGLFPHSPEGLSAMFRTYELAAEFMDGPPNNGCSVPNVDWMTLFTFLKGKGPDYWRHEFIALSEEIPRQLRKAAQDCGSSYMHHGNQYSNKDMFVLCGDISCKICSKYEVVIAKLDYGHNLSEMIQLKQYPEVFFADGTKRSSGMTYKVSQMLKEKKYPEVTPQMWVEAWNGLEPFDPFYPTLAELLKKFAKNQVSDNKEWTDMVYKIVKNGGK